MLTKELATSLVTIILAIFAIAVFISSGGSMLFYIAVSIAIVFGFFNAWLVTKAVGKAAAHGHAGKRSTARK